MTRQSERELRDALRAGERISRELAGQFSPARLRQLVEAAQIEIAQSGDVKLAGEIDRLLRDDFDGLVGEDKIISNGGYD